MEVSIKYSQNVPRLPHITEMPTCRTQVGRFLESCIQTYAELTRATNTDAAIEARLARNMTLAYLLKCCLDHTQNGAN